ncbi:putative transcription elongation factor, nusA [Desulfurococcus amylolyticus 1221n]|uniref:Putative transcription elongation factor, nusA n=1 Tax=Desulfurococcus amylolyticus (strain DSM 18924 / JCM 16383 / VKM B-2413 / 1221n) TaxID=490899 RepID=B8D5L9_DESA1|nr:putative transcription elongation factor, nusA [Desulfurococcus amylolyticus 1221n]
MESGTVREDEIPVMRILMDLEEELKFLKKGEYVRSFRISNQVIVMLRNGFEPGEISELERELSQKLGDRVKVVIETGDVKRLIEQLIAPASLIGVNQVWLPSGSEMLNVRVSKRDRRILGRNREEYEKLLSSLLGVETRIIFE